MSTKVIDLHCDSVFSLIAGKDLRQPVQDVHVDLPRLRAGNVGLQVFAAYVPPNTAEDQAFAYTIERLNAIDAFALSDDFLAPVENALELQAILDTDKVGIMAAVENGLAIENSLEKLEALRRCKVRILTLVHSEHLNWVTSCTGTGNTQDGLSSFGEQVIDAMNDLRIIPDISHSSEKAFWDVLKRSKKPIIASHSCAWHFCGAARNLKDDQLKALGDSGGLAAVNFFNAFLSEDFRLQYTSAKEKSIEKPETTCSTVKQSIIADHIEYMLNLAGEDCIALGSDFDGISAAPEGVTGSDFYPTLETELRARGYSDKRIKKIFYANFHRILEEWDK